MAFGDVYGYKTNVSTVVAFAEGDEYANPAAGAEVGTTGVDEDGNTLTLVDLVLTGFSSGSARRGATPVGTGVNQAQTAAAINA